MGGVRRVAGVRWAAPKILYQDGQKKLQEEMADYENFASWPKISLEEERG